MDLDFFLTWVAYDALTITILLTIVGIFFSTRWLFRKVTAMTAKVVELPETTTEEEIDELDRKLDELTEEFYAKDLTIIEEPAFEELTLSQEYFLHMSDVALMNDIKTIQNMMKLNPDFVHEDYLDALNEALFRGLIK